MKASFILLLLMFSITAFAQDTKTGTNIPDSSKKIQTVEASCGQCQFKLPGKGCDLAVRINGKAYFVDGTKIDDHGDAHAADGFCEAIRNAEVQGKIRKKRFRASYFRLLETR